MSMAEPLVGIGIPVYNGGRRLREALDSILAQRWTDFEVLISDNGSTDDTASICAEYADRDSRIRYVRHPQNRGLPFNWNYVARNTRGRYFKWASSNDLIAPRMLELCTAALEADPEAVVAYGRTALVGMHGEPVRDYDADFAILDPSPAQRLLAAHRIGLNNPVCGVIRRSALAGSPLIRPYPASDYVLISELALRGKFVLVPEILFLRRTDPSSITTDLRRVDSIRLHDPSSTGREAVALRRYLDLIGVACTVGRLGARERLKAIVAAGRIALWARRRILADTVAAVRGEHGAARAG
jgi:glycosyltransferase involved in cell wall biosynthesis